MERLTKVLVVLALVAALGATASAAATYANGGDWDDAATWPFTAPSTATDYVYTYYGCTDATPLVVDTGMVAETEWLRLITWGATDGSLVVNGGSFTTYDYGSFSGLMMGDADGGLTTSEVYFNGGDVNLTRLNIWGSGASHTITQTGGTVDIDELNVGQWGGTSHLDYLLIDGYLALNGNWYDDSGFTQATGSIHVSMTDGELVMDDGVMAEALSTGGLDVNGTVATAGNLSSLLSGTSLGDGRTSYVLVPEPATMVLLGLGALVLRRKK